VQEPQNHFARVSPKPAAAPATQDFHQAFESLVLSRNGGVLIVGWIDDSTVPIDAITVAGNGWSLRFDADELARVRRTDVEQALGTQAIHRYGYFGFIAAGEKLATSSDFQIEISLQGGWTIHLACSARVIDDADLLDIALTYLAGTQHFETPELGAIAAIDGGLANEILTFQQIIGSHAGAPYIKRFGSNRGRYRGSVIVHLHDSVERYPIQSALFAAGPAHTQYEFIYVCDSPRQAERLLDEARLVAKLYDTDQTIVILPAAAGRGAARNAGAAVAQSDRLLLADCGLVPRDRDWVEKHEAILDIRAPHQTMLFSALLFHENGALRHAGLYYDLQSGPYLRRGDIVRLQVAGLKELANGVSPEATIKMEPHPVPCIGSAFMSLDRGWFEELGGFSQDYLHGDYQDADICLKSIAAGVPPWLHDLRFWHATGGAVSSPTPYRGASIVNRWLFSGVWGDKIAENLSGKAPIHPAFQNVQFARGATQSAYAQDIPGQDMPGQDMPGQDIPGRDMPSKINRSAA
jgi:hypothetical protein